MSLSKKTLWPVIVVVASVVLAFILVLSKPSVETESPTIPPKWIRVLQVRTEPVQMLIASQGSVEPRTKTALVAEVGGRVTEVSDAFVAGGFFDRGDVLISIDSRDYEFAVSQAESQVAQAELKVQVTEREGHLARTEWQKRNTGEMPALVTYEPQMAQARSALAAAKASLDQARLNLERTRIRAPYEGRVRAKSVDVGQYLIPGTPVGQVYAVDYVEVRLPLPDRELAFLGIPFDFSSKRNGHLGPPVTLRGRFAGESLEWQGSITRIEGEVDARSRMVYAVARVEDPYDRVSGAHKSPLAVGMFVEAEITGTSSESFTKIPRGALRDLDRVLVVAPDSTLRFRSVEVARLSSEDVYVRSGLQDGEYICVSPLAVAVEGMPIRIFSDEEPASEQAAVRP
jgi:RND family efflux transporter MFP subunit